MKTLDQVISELEALRDAHGGGISVALWDDGDATHREFGQAEYEEKVNIDYEHDQLGNYVDVPRVVTLSAKSCIRNQNR